MKTFSIIKTGYSAGMYGCSNEYFALISHDEKGGNCIRFRGLYGADDRIREIMKGRGYTEVYAWGHCGQLKGQERTDANKFSKSEAETIQYIDFNF